MDEPSDPIKDSEQELLTNLESGDGAAYSKFYKEWYNGRENEAKASSLNATGPFWLPACLHRTASQVIIRGRDASVLDIGCGFGSGSLMAAKNCGEVDGIDISEKAVSIARDRARKMGLNNVRFNVGDALNLDFQDNHFDWVCSKDVIEHFRLEDAKKHLRETARVLKPGGNYIVATPHEWGRHRQRPGHLTAYTYKGIHKLLIEAGFSSVRSAWFRTNIVTGIGHKERLESFLRALGIKVFWSALGVRNLVAIGRK